MAAHFGSNSFPTEFNFIENPIIVNVDYDGFPGDSTFRQIVIQVQVTFTWDTSAHNYYFYADASSGSNVSVDISSALRASMKGWEPDAASVSLSGTSSITYPHSIFNVWVWQKYMQDGIVVEDTANTTSRIAALAYYGGLTQYELLTYNRHVYDFCTSLDFSRKPSSGELQAVGDIKTTSSFDGSSVKTTTSIVTTADFEKGELQQFLFVNSLGVLETVSAFSRESLAYGIESETKNLASAPAYFAKPNRTTHKTGGRGKFAMSSGFITRDWADWWTTEFLMAKKYWMLYDGRWLPVTVTPADDESTVYNKAEQRIPHVDFDVEIAVEGSIRNRVRTT